MIAYSVTYMSHIIFSDLKRKKDLNQLVLSKTQRKIIHQNVKSYPLHQEKAQADTSLTLAEPKPSTSSGKRKERASTKGDMSRESRSTSLTTSAASRKQVKIEKELFGMCVSYETDMIIFNTIKRMLEIL